MNKKYELKQISFYGKKLEDVLRAFMQIDSKKLKQQLKKEIIKSGGDEKLINQSNPTS